MDLPNPYKGNYKILVIIPILMVAAALYLILVSPGIIKGVDFKGGILVTILSNSSLDAGKLEAGLKADGYTVTSLNTVNNPTGSLTEVELERSPLLESADQLKNAFYTPYSEASRLESSLLFSNDSSTLAAYNSQLDQARQTAQQMFDLAKSGKKATDYESPVALRNAVTEDWNHLSTSENAALRASFANHATFTSISFDEVTSSLSSKFFDNAITIVVWSTILVTIAVFIIFRTFWPSIAVLTGAVSDVLIAMGAMAIFGIPLTLASFAALLMLIGFSLDTDILLTMRVIKRKEGHASERAYEAMKTGLTMSASVMLAFLALFALAALTNIRIYYEISSVAIAGLVGDVFATWLFNAVIILHHAEELEKSGGSEPQKPLAGFIFRK